MITSTANSQVKNLLQLQKKAKVRRQQQAYIVEGIRMFREAPREDILQVYVSESFLKQEAHKKALNGMKYEVFSDTVFAHVSDTKTPQGILLVMRMKQTNLHDVLGRKNGIWLILENIQDPGNLGTMFRTGEGAGIAGVIMDGNTVDIYNPKTIRSTMGSIYRVPFCIVENLTDTVRALQEKGISVYAAHLEGSVCYDEPDYRAASSFMIGNEGNGLTPETTALADQYIRIPMGGQLESLNAAMAAGILMYEANRQRRS